MENNAKNNIVKATAATLGAIHFIAYSVAELAVHTEAKLINKHNGTPIEDVIKQRLFTTISRQEAIKARIQQAKQHSAQSAD